ncbi:regulator of chromosome condensation 1/beta-lactamase-inhibitor protein II, partial [Baffinella frigidus]
PGCIEVVICEEVGGILTWGCNIFGQLSAGGRLDRFLPGPASGLIHGRVSLDSVSGEDVSEPPAATRDTRPQGLVIGARHALAFRGCEVLGWGRNKEGQIATHLPASVSRPAVVLDVSEGEIRQLAAGAQHSLCLFANGTLLSWGDDSRGQLGRRSDEPRGQPGLSVKKEVAAGAFHSLARTASGEVWAWGSNLPGQLGNGGVEGSSKPVRAIAVVPALTPHTPPSPHSHWRQEGDSGGGG